MKKNLVVTTLFMLFTFTTFCQEVNDKYKTTENTYAKNEIRLNLFSSLLGLPEANYERFLEDNFGVGAYAAFSLENVYDSNLRSMYMVFGRLYLDNTKPCSGFYIEGNTGLVLQKKVNYYGYYNYYDGYNSSYNYGYSVESKTQAGLGLGVAVGYKFLTKNNF